VDTVPGTHAEEVVSGPGGAIKADLSILEADLRFFEAWEWGGSLFECYPSRPAGVPREPLAGAWGPASGLRPEYPRKNPPEVPYPAAEVFGAQKIPRLVGLRSGEEDEAVPLYVRCKSAVW
jgi:hypothetical protein